MVGSNFWQLVVFIPKPKPDQIIRYEFVLGKVERQQLEQANAAYSINRVLNPLVTLLNDVTGVATVLGILAVALGFKYNVYTAIGATTADLIQDFADQARQAGVDAKAGAESIYETATNPMTYLNGLIDLAYNFTPVGYADNSILDPLGLPTIQGTIESGILNLDLYPNYGDPWFGLDLNPFN